MKSKLFICANYVYDANVLFFFRQDKSDPENIKYIAVDWYGRIINKEWFDKRQKHNKRICYEFSRFYAKAINMLIDTNDMEAVIVGDVENTHYVVGLTGRDYSIILDQDDFSNIKDLTRFKLDLALNGIHILRDDSGIFAKIVEDYNSTKSQELPKIRELRLQYKETDFIQFLQSSISEINKYNIDSQGFFECMRYLIDEAEIEIKKIWKFDNRAIAERRHERCLYFNYEGKIYLLDSIEQSLSVVDVNELDKNIYIFKPEENEYKYYGA